MRDRALAVVRGEQRGGEACAFTDTDQRQAERAATLIEEQRPHASLAPNGECSRDRAHSPKLVLDPTKAVLLFAISRLEWPAYALTCVVFCTAAVVASITIAARRCNSAEPMV